MLRQVFNSKINQVNLTRQKLFLAKASGQRPIQENKNEFASILFLFHIMVYQAYTQNFLKLLVLYLKYKRYFIVAKLRPA